MYQKFEIIMKFFFRGYAQHRIYGRGIVLLVNRSLSYTRSIVFKSAIVIVI